jgi:hypothetical protein
VEEIFMDLFGFSRPTYYKWKRENIKVIQLLEKYFSKDELEEFLEAGSIRKLETEKFKNFVDPLFIEYVKFNLPSKMDKIKGEGLIMRLNRLIPNHILTTILKEIKEDEDIELHQDKSKKFLIDRIKGYAASFEKKSSQKQLIDLIDKNFSNIECYALIKYYDEILDKD